MGIFLTDFGLARNVATGSRYTRTGETLGTPAYMSPEQARGELSELTPASDVWALGCVCYEMVSGGRKAFDGDSPAAVIGAVLTTTPAMPPGLSRSVSTVTRVCLQQRPLARYQAAGTLRDDLARVIDGAPPRARVPRPGFRLGIVAGGLIALGVGAVAIVPSLRRSGPPAPDAAMLEAEALARQGWELRRADVVRAREFLHDALERSPDRHDWWVRLGLLEWAAGEGFERAAAAWRKVPRGSDQWARAMWLSGMARLGDEIGRSGPVNSPEVRKLWTEVAAGTGSEAELARAGLLFLDRGLPEARVALGRLDHWSAALLRGLIELALQREASDHADGPGGIEAFTRAITEGFPSWIAHYGRGTLRWDAGDLLGARRDLDDALSLAPGNPRTLALRGVVRNKSGDQAGAEADYDAALMGRPGDPATLVNRGILRADQGRFEDALADFDAALQRRPDWAEARNARAHARAQVGDVTGALADLELALSLRPDMAVFWFHRGTLREEQGDTAGALSDLDEAVDRDPRFVAARFRRGQLRRLRGAIRSALEDLDVVLQHDPEHVRARVNRARARVALGDLAAALVDFDAAIIAQPEAETLIERASIRRRLGDVAGAVEDCDAAVRADPGHGGAWLKRGNLRRQMGNLAEAIDDYKAALRADPSLVLALGALGRAHAERGEWELARKAFEAFLAQAPTHPNAPNVRRWLAEHRGRSRGGDGH